MSTRRCLLATTALLCVGGLTWGAVSVGTGGAAVEPGTGTTPTVSPEAQPSPEAPQPVDVTATPSAPDPVPAVPSQPPATTGLAGPVSAVLADAPAAGPVRVVTLVHDAQGHPQIDVTTAPDRAEAAAAVEEGRATPGAIAVTVDRPVQAAGVGEPTPVSDTAAATDAGAAAHAASASNDQYRYLQWALDALSGEAAWGLTTAVGQTVAVVDSGVDGTHPDLTGRVLPGIDYIGGSDGRIDPNGHGTHVAGIIGAVAGNGKGIAGLATEASILPVRVLEADGNGWSSDVANGIIWAADHGATTVNLSLGGDSSDPVSAAAVSYAQSKDVVVVAAAGNGRQEGNAIHYPAAYPGVVAVAATDEFDASASFSQTGSFVTLAAPGVSILSTYPVAQGSYVYMNGTSMATPYAAAAAALVRAAAPTLSATDVVADLVATTRDLGAAGRDDEFGAGLIDPVAALQALTTAPGSTFQSLPPARVLDTRNGTGAPVGRVGPGGTVNLQVTGRGGVPASGVTAVVLNVTAVGPTSSGFVTVYPAGRPRPLASNLNTVRNGTVPNLVVVRVGTGGQVNIYNDVGTVQLIADIAGYYTDATTGSTFQSLPPARVLDTRNGTGAPAARVGPGGTVNLQVTGRGGVPATGVTAVVLNVTAVGPTSSGYVTVYPADQPRPLASNLNTVRNGTVPNLVVVQVGTGGQVNIYNDVGTVQLIADIAGYYTDATTGSTFQSLPPARVLDTRNGTGAPAARVGPGGTVNLQVTGRGGVPASGVTAVVLNVTAVGPTSSGFVTAYPAGQPRPLASNLNTVRNGTVPNLVVVQVGADGKVNIYNDVGTVQLIADIAGYYAG